MKTGIELIAVERQRQIEKEEWTTEHDKQHFSDELATVASLYAMPERQRIYDDRLSPTPVNFPWSSMWWKPSPDNRIKELIKAGALIAAEIDRIQLIEK
jgi:hypothetical protein